MSNTFLKWDGKNISVRICMLHTLYLEEDICYPARDRLEEVLTKCMNLEVGHWHTETLEMFVSCGSGFLPAARHAAGLKTTSEIQCSANL